MTERSEIIDEESLLAKHRKEKKDLQSKIQALKKTATKGDKKKRKEILEEVAALESDLERKQNEELTQLREIPKAEVIANGVEDLQLEEVINDTEGHQKRTTKAQKRRDKKATKEKEREKLIEIQESENILGVKHIETEKIKQILKDRNLMIHEIPSDGNCLYCAVDYALTSAGREGIGVLKLRSMTSEYLRKHSLDFMPFLSNPQTGDMLTEKQYEEYCDQVSNTSAWGGQVELRALSHILQCPIEVIQATGPEVVVGEEYTGQKRLILTYHRHLYRLGEHYNAVKPYLNDEEEPK